MYEHKEVGLDVKGIEPLYCTATALLNTDVYESRMFLGIKFCPRVVYMVIPGQVRM